jgi:hypothetical protein
MDMTAMKSMLLATPPIGHERELSRLVAAVRSRTPLLIYGPPDAGKSFLVQRFLRGLSRAEQSCCVYLRGFVSVHTLLEGIVSHLFAADSALRRDGLFAPPELPQRFRGSTSGKLRVLLRTAARERRLCLFLDDFPPISHFLVRLLKELIWKDESSVNLVARGKARDEIGCAWSIYYAPDYRLEMSPFHDREAKALLDQSVRQFGIASLATPEFRAEVLRRSTGRPGTLVKMCAMAANPRYHFGNQIKLHLLHVDYLMQGNAPVRSGPHRAGSRQ